MRYPSGSNSLQRLQIAGRTRDSGQKRPSSVFS